MVWPEVPKLRSLPVKCKFPLAAIQSTFVVRPWSLYTSKRSAVGLATLGARLSGTASWPLVGWAVTALVVPFTVQLEGRPTPPLGVAGVQAVPFQVRTWLAVGAVEATGRPWRPSTTGDAAGPVMSLPSWMAPMAVEVAAGNCEAAAVPDKLLKPGCAQVGAALSLAPVTNWFAAQVP